MRDYEARIPGSMSELYDIMQNIKQELDYQQYDAMEQHAMELEFEAKRMQFLLQQHIRSQ